MDNKYIEQEYLNRINRVIDYIQNNLDKNLSLIELSKVSNFSQYHFHRIFSSLVGETLYSFIQRLKIEKAASQLIYSPKKSITEIAFDSGFASSASFAKLFKASYGMSASKWRNGGCKKFDKINSKNSKNRQLESNNGKAFENENSYLSNVITNESAQQNYYTIDRRCTMKVPTKTHFEIKNIANMNVAYVRHFGAYQGNEELFAGLWSQLMGWAGPRELLNQPDMKSMCVYYDDPEITESKNLRVDVCITVPEGTKTEGVVGNTVIEGGQYAVHGFEVSAEEFQGAWSYIYSEWLPQSGYQPDDRPCFELYLNDHRSHPEGKFLIEICIPIKPL